jgi:hypothetical protein
MVVYHLLPLLEAADNPSILFNPSPTSLSEPIFQSTALLQGLGVCGEITQTLQYAFKNLQEEEHWLSLHLLLFVGLWKSCLV